MCEGSIYEQHRLATSKEKLVVKTIRNHGIKGFYDPDGLLTCVRGSVKAVLKQVEFLSNAPHRGIVEEWQGKRNVTVTLQHKDYTDWVIFPDGQKVHLTYLKDGMAVSIGYPVKPAEPKGMKVLAASMREALALPPDPKPEDEDAPSTPAEQAPARQPAPVGDEPKARRRR
jgi:hypothetical protein